MTADIILSAVASSAKLGKIRLHEVRGKIFKTRGQMHALIIEPFGTGKTTSLVPLKNFVRLTDYTLPALVGTIKKEGQFISGAVKACAGKVLVIDEVQHLAKKAKMALLDLLENQQHQRSLGYCLNAPVKDKKAYYSVKGINNRFDVKAQFSCICSGTYIADRSSLDKAWKSRFFPYFVLKDKENIFEMLEGNQDLEIDEQNLTGDSDFKDWLEFVSEYKKLINSLPITEYFKGDNLGYLSRTAHDIARIANYLSKKKGSNIILKEDWQKALTFAPLQLSNYVKTKLNVNEFKVFEYAKLKQSEIVDIVKLSKGEVSKCISKLKSYGLLNEKEKQNEN